jgi:hypothetical protein
MVGPALLLTFVLHPLLGLSEGNRPKESNGFICGTTNGREHDALARGLYQESLRRHREAERRAAGLPATTEHAISATDVGDVAVLEDDGTLVLEARSFNLTARAFRFEPSGASSYRLVESSNVFDSRGGANVMLRDDDTSSQDLGFRFLFFGKNYTAVQLNSDGNLTFEKLDNSNSDRDLGRFLSGPPRIGPLFADLDPSAGGMVSIRNDGDGVLFAWTGVKNFGSALTNSFSVKLFRSGAIEFVYGSNVNTPEAVVGISPGAGVNRVSAVEFANALPGDSQEGTIVEVFSATAKISETEVARRFFENHPDRFDQITLFLGFGFELNGGAYAYEIPVRNDARGIGLGELDNSARFGSQGTLRAFLNMGSLDGIDRYPADPDQKYLGTNSTLTILGHEFGHQWLAFAAFRDGSVNSRSILGRDNAHWSFFFNSEGSVMEGNAIQDNGAERGNSRFVTVAATNTYSPLDRYLMGFAGRDEVPPSFVVQNPVGIMQRDSSSPQIGVVFGGDRRDVTIDSVVTALGRRTPSAFETRKVLRQAFILLTRKGETAAPAQIEKVQKIRDAWVDFFHAQTDGLGWIVTDLQDTAGTTLSRILFPHFQGDSGGFTGIALANWGRTPADVRFWAYDDTGKVLTSPGIVNPHVITIAPGAQIAMLAEQIHALSMDTTRSGWIEAQSSSSQISSFFFNGDIEQSFLSGAVVGDRSEMKLYFMRGQFPSSNLIVVVNPNSAGAKLTFSLMDGFGNVQATATRTLNPSGRSAEELSALFPGSAGLSSTGYVVLTSDQRLVGYQVLKNGSTVYSLPAQHASEEATLYSAQFASGRAGSIRYFTEFNLINTSTETRNLRLVLVGEDGSPVVASNNPASFSLAPGQQKRLLGDTEFGLPDTVFSFNLIQGSLTVTADGPGIIGDVLFGDVAGGRFVASLPLESTPASDLVLAQVAQGSAGGETTYFTGVALYNPNPSDLTVTVDVYSEDGSKTGTSTFALVKGGRVSGTLPQLVPAITNQVRGYICIHASGGPLVAFGLYGPRDLGFLSAIPAQPIQP